MIKIYDDHIDFLSPGTIFGNLSLDDILHGNASYRNKHLVSSLHRLGIIEAYGTGMIKILHSYHSSLLRPKILTSESTFSVKLPNRNNFSSKIVHISTAIQEEYILDFIEKKWFYYSQRC
ncbi:MAG: hypothetical protein LBR80_13655 [Deltaproteobacteria bacterium]|nr:hypothetical protein [Deltaproteobacteria bacterium]